MSSEGISITCPYCGTNTYTCYPKEAQEEKGFWLLRRNGDDRNLADLPDMPKPHEIECMPYTRDVDKFDPKPEDENPNDLPKYWSEIGKDFLKFLAFEKIGILRNTNENLNVRYRVCRCVNPECSRLFDVFLNYSIDEETAIKFKDLWPHLFKPAEDNSKEIEKYKGISIVLYSLRNFGEKLKSNNLAITIFCLILLLLPLFPWLINPADHGNDQFILQDIKYFNNPDLLYSGLQNFLISFVAVLAVGLSLLFEDQYLYYMENTRDFYNLLKVEQKNKGVTFWRNYILCRIVGVQIPKKIPGFNQADVFAGGLSILTLITIWILNNLKPIQWIPLGFNLVILGCIIILVSFSNNKRLLGPLFIGTTLLVAIFILVSYLSFWQTPQTFWDGISASFNLLFWVIVAYFFGIGAFLGMNIALYVVKGLTRIPMNLTLFNGLAQSLPLRKLQIFLSEMLLVLFLSTLIIVAGIFLFPIILPFSTSGEFQWLLDWLRWGLTLLFAALGFGAGSRWYFFLAVIYCALSLFNDQFVSFPTQAYVNIILLGCFLTLLIAYQIFSIDGLVKQLFNEVRERELGEIDSKIIAMQKILQKQEIKDSIPHNQHGALQAIQDYMLLREKLDQMKVNQLLWRRIVELLTLSIVSIILPLLGLLKK